ncbi:MAG: hypothetical protein KGI56_09145 [Acidobacteriota bacterium]|nr:hypothetical protein [Acidobacteriota bacterium]
MAFEDLQPWLPPSEPDLVRLAWEAADAAGVAELRSWPEVRKGGIGFGSLPAFLAWRGTLEGRYHLVLLQVREIGALVPGARKAGLPEGWLETLDLPSLARPLARHPDFPGSASVHVVHLLGGNRVRVRTWGDAAPSLVAEVLRRLSGLEGWRFV